MVLCLGGESPAWSSSSLAGVRHAAVGSQAAGDLQPASAFRVRWVHWVGGLSEVARWLSAVELSCRELGMWHINTWTGCQGIAIPSWCPVKESTLRPAALKNSRVRVVFLNPVLWSGTVPSTLPPFLCQGAHRMVSSLGGSQAGHCFENVVILDPALLARSCSAIRHCLAYMMHGRN